MAKQFVLAELNENHELINRIKTILQNATRQKVVLIITEKLTKKANVVTKRINFQLEEGQELGLVFRNDGDVINVFLNKKALPLRNIIDAEVEKTIKQGVEDIATKIRANQDRFDIKRRTAKVIIPRNKSAALTVSKRIKLAREELARLDEVLKKRQSDLIALKESIDLSTQAAAVGKA